MVTISVSSGSSGGTGSGIILDTEGHILTNTHVVTLDGAAADAAVEVRTNDGQFYKATIVGTDPLSDLAVIKIDARVAFHQSTGRLPVSHGKSARERALGAWLAHRRQEAVEGTLSPAYADALVAIPGWDRPSTRKAGDEARWQRRLEKLQECRAAGGDWPRHQKTEDAHERALGVWLHVQRIDYRAGRPDPAKESKLNELLPGWQEGRGLRGGRRS